MKKLIIILFVTLVATATGLYFRPSYALIGQLDWFKVITKGYFVGSIAGFFSQTYIDESFWFVMRFTGGGMLAGFLVSIFFSGKKSASKKRA